MIQPQQMQNRRVQVMHVHLVFGGVVTVVVGRSVGVTALHAAAGHPHRKAVRIVVASVVTLCRRRPPELAAPQHQRVVRADPRAFKSLKKPAIGLSTSAAFLVWPWYKFAC